MASLETLLRPLLEPVDGQYPRPWMTDYRAPAAARVFTVGRNQRNGFPVHQVGSMDAFIDALFNKGPESCRAMYDRISGAQSRTRRNTDRLVAALARHGVEDVVQTNAVCFSTPMSSDLRLHAGGAERGRAIFETIFHEIRPRVMIAHGAGTARDIHRVLGFPLTNPPDRADQISSSLFRGTELIIIPSLAPPAYNRWSSWADAHLELVARHAARTLTRGDVGRRQGDAAGIRTSRERPR